VIRAILSASPGSASGYRVGAVGWWLVPALPNRGLPTGLAPKCAFPA